jgi:hypothetical protein
MDSFLEMAMAWGAPLSHDQSILAKAEPAEVTAERSSRRAFWAFGLAGGRGKAYDCSFNSVIDTESQRATS